MSAKALATAMQARLEAAGYTVYTGSGVLIGGPGPGPQPLAHLRVPIEFATTHSWTFTVAVFASPGAAAQARRVSLRLVRTYCNLRHEPLASCAARPQGRQRLVGQIEYDAFRDVTGQAPPPLVQFNRLIAIASGR